MSKSLSNKLQETIKKIVAQLKSEEKLPTQELILEYLQKNPNYSRTKEQLLIKEIQQFTQNLEEDKNAVSTNFMNKQLPYIKNKLIEQKKALIQDLDKEASEEIKKKYKREVNNNYNDDDNDANPNSKEQKSLKIDLNKILNLDEIGGIDKIIESIKYNVYLPLENPKIFANLRVTPPKGTLLTGPVGSGKTALGLAICKDIHLRLGYPFFFKQSTEIVGGVSGESEKNLRQLFIDACTNAPSVIFIDEIDAIAGSRDKASKEMEKRIVSELLSCLDKLPDNVHIIAATARPESLEQSIRRGGRFDTEILLPVPNEKSRKQILSYLTKNNPLGDDVKIDYLAKSTPGYVAADLTSLVRKAGLFAVKRIVDQQKQEKKEEMDSKLQAQQSEQQQQPTQSQQLQMDSQEKFSALKTQQTVSQQTEMILDESTQQQQQQPEQQQNQQTSNEQLSLGNNTKGEEVKNNGEEESEKQNYIITKYDFDKALLEVQPTGQREGFASIPNVSWEDIGGLPSLKEELINNIILPIEQPENFEKFNIMSPIGVLLYGPPGVGKTLLAKATANASKANFISVKGPELLNKYVGESEKAVRSVFNRANASAPCIIFFDEIDALCPKRGQGDGNQVTERIVNALLVEMDGVDVRKQVYIIAATNRPDILDPALLRGGRLDKQLYVPLPDAGDRFMILKALTRKMPLEADVDLKQLASSERCEGFSGADLYSLVKESGLKAILKKQDKATMNDFVESLQNLLPSISPKNRHDYEKYQKNLKQTKNSIQTNQG